MVFSASVPLEVQEMHTQRDVVSLLSLFLATKKTLVHLVKNASRTHTVKSTCVCVLKDLSVIKEPSNAETSTSVPKLISQHVESMLFAKTYQEATSVNVQLVSTEILSTRAMNVTVRNVNANRHINSSEEIVFLQDVLTEKFVPQELNA